MGLARQRSSHGEVLRHLFTKVLMVRLAPDSRAKNSLLVRIFDRRDVDNPTRPELRRESETAPHVWLPRRRRWSSESELLPGYDWNV